MYFAEREGRPVLVAEGIMAGKLSAAGVERYASDAEHEAAGAQDDTDRRKIARLTIDGHHVSIPHYEFREAATFLRCPERLGDHEQLRVFLKFDATKRLALARQIEHELEFLRESQERARLKPCSANTHSPESIPFGKIWLRVARQAAFQTIAA